MFSVIGVVVVTFFIPHYVAVITAIIIALVLQSMRHLRLWRPEGRAIGTALVRALVMLSVVLIPLHAWLWAGEDTKNLTSIGPQRARIMIALEALPDKQLVIVRYRPQHDPLQEWVYNDADIDGSKVVWARDGPGNRIGTDSLLQGPARVGSGSGRQAGEAGCVSA